MLEYPNAGDWILYIWRDIRMVEIGPDNVRISECWGFGPDNVRISECLGLDRTML